YLTKALPKQYCPRQTAAIYVSIKSDVLLHDNGRYFFVFLKTLSSNFPNIAINGFGLINYYKMGSYGRRIYTLKNLKIGQKIPTDRKNRLLIYDVPLARQKMRGWGNCIQIESDISKLRPADNQWALMPYCMHPKIYDLFDQDSIETLRHSDRKIRLFFAGSIDKTVYSGRGFWRKQGFDLMPRAKIIATIQTGLSDRISPVANQQDLTSLFQSGTHKKVVLVNSKRFYIPQKKWLSLLSGCDFFICPPGIDMPLCHNAIESMAVGTIPLINYPHWFSPGLKDLHNCVTYKTEAELLTKINLILSMPDEQISDMRKNVINYYQKYLDFDTFYQQLINSQHQQTTLFFNTGNRDILKQITPQSVIWG
ncbi:MAG: hypothetical protein AAGF93_03345, partial [Cyanobacteria bacterium P01_H01_bin.105]